jgi:hypothetical protein
MERKGKEVRENYVLNEKNNYFSYITYANQTMRKKTGTGDRKITASSINWLYIHFN